MNYAAVKWFDVANGPGTRVSLFVSGCTHRCEGCFNEVAWDFGYGEPFTEDVLKAVVERGTSPLYSGITLLGGEPMEPANAEALVPLADAFREKASEGQTIWCFSGYLFEELAGERFAKFPQVRRLLEKCDVLVDGEFVAALKDVALTFRGSSNQRILDAKKSLAAGKPIPWEPGPDLTLSGKIR